MEVIVILIPVAGIDFMHIKEVLWYSTFPSGAKTQHSPNESVSVQKNSISKLLA